MEPERTTPRETLDNRLRALGELRERLLHVHWQRDTLALAARAARELSAFAEAIDAPQELGALAGRLQAAASEAAAASASMDARRRVLDLLARLGELQAPMSAGIAQAADPFALRDGAAVLLAAGDWAEEAALRLELAGLQVRTVADMAALLAMRDEDLPAVVVLDLDLDPPGQALDWLQRQGLRMGPRRAVICVSERSDMAARLEAVQTGCAGYATRPPDPDRLLDLLCQHLAPVAGTADRVLLVSDAPTEARETVRALEREGFQVQLLTQPRQLLQQLEQMRPDAVVLNLHHSTSGVRTLAAVLRQHERWEDLPVLMLAGGESAGVAPITAADGEDVIVCAPGGAALTLAIRHRIAVCRRSRRLLAAARVRDTVSGLYGRGAFVTALNALLADTTPATAGILLVGVDRPAPGSAELRLVDHAVALVARRLLRALGPGHRPARLRDGLFAVMFPDTYAQALEAAGRMVHEAVTGAVIPWEDGTVALRVSVGMALMQRGRGDAFGAIGQAEAALAIARASTGAGRVRLYEAGRDSARHPDSDHFGRLLQEVGSAIREQRLRLVFQPIARLRADGIERYEVLLRLRDRDGHDLLPETVFALVQDHGIGVVLERWVIAQALRLLGERRCRGLDMVLFVNVSMAIFRDSALADWLRPAVQRSGLDPAALVFELADSIAAAAPDPAEVFAARVRGLGFGLALDRFEPDADGIERAGRLQATCVKLDGVRSWHAVTGSGPATDALAALRAQGVDVIVTGIEDPALLPQIACGEADFVQGYGVARPGNALDHDFVAEQQA